MNLFVHNVIKELIKNKQKERSGKIVTREDVLKNTNLPRSACRAIIIGCIHLDLNTEPDKKTFYVDGHKKAETVAYRKEYIC